MSWWGDTFRFSGDTRTAPLPRQPSKIEDEDDDEDEYDLGAAMPNYNKSGRPSNRDPISKHRFIRGSESGAAYTELSHAAA